METEKNSRVETVTDSMGVKPVKNHFKSMKRGLGRAAKGAGRVLAIAVAVTVLAGIFRPLPGTVAATNPIMHNSSSLKSTKWGGDWGNNFNSKYGKFTCTTCHAAGPASGNVKQIKNVITTPANSRGETFQAGIPNLPVTFFSSTSFGSQSLTRSSSNRICDVCHTITNFHRYNNTAVSSTHKGDIDCVGCHQHRNGFKGIASEGDGTCSTCHSDLYGSTVPGVYGMHSDTAKISYKHYLQNDDQTYTTGPAGIPDGATNLTSRRCTMCHVTHSVFSVQSSPTTGRAYNLRDRADGSNTTQGFNDDYNLCLSCHYQGKTKYLMTPNNSTKVMPIPFNGLTYANATSVLTFSTHGYAVNSRFDGGVTPESKKGSSTFRGICVKCHNDTIGANGDIGYKSAEKGQDSKYKFGEHNSTIPSRFAVYGNTFYQRPPDTKLTTLAYLAPTGGPYTITITDSSPGAPNQPNWVVNSFTGFTVTVTAGAGSNQRARVISNLANQLTLASVPGNPPFQTALDNTSFFDLSNDNISVDDVCFSCHSKAGQNKFIDYSGRDWYGTGKMKKPLEGIKDLFVGDSGSVGRFSGTSVTVTTTNSWTANALLNYQFKCPAGVRTITANTASTPVAGGYSTTLTISPRISNNTAGGFEILKPASHPLDQYSRHDSYERITAAPGFNVGDTGTVTTGSATSITDSTKSWSGSEFGALNMYIWFPGNFDTSGAPAKSKIGATGGTGIVNFTAIPGYTPAIGDNYFIGDINGGGRHVACADCHNTHATYNNPEGDVTSAPTTKTLKANDSANKPGWRANSWAGFLIKVTKVVSSTQTLEQIRYITAFDKVTGTYTVSLDWSFTPDNTCTYEVLMGDKWTPGSQSGGRAGSGSSGTWGVLPTGWRSPALGNMTGATGFRKVENVFDTTGSLGGDAVAGQRDLCVKCHSSFAYGVTTPNTPSGTATNTANTVNARSTDVAKEFNPSNLAHHAVYARGQNQPIRANYGNLNTTQNTSVINPNWPLIPGTLSSITTGGPENQPGYVTLATGALPVTAQPGWFMYIGSSTPVTKTPQAGAPTTGWVEITHIVDSTHFYVRRESAPGTWPNVTYNSNITNAGTQAVAITAGLGNAFVPPYGPWSVLRCTDCHGSTKKDPVGPHASVNRWLIKDGDKNLTFYWYNGTGVVPVSPNTSMSSTNYFCFNCHRRDVYCDPVQTDPASTSFNLGRQPHGKTAFDGRTDILTEANTTWKQYCRMCHAGDKLGGIHGTNAKNGYTGGPGTGAPITNLQGKRFLNGSSWGTFATGGGVARSTTTKAGACYTANKQNPTVDNCAKTHTGGTTVYGAMATYDYDNP